MAPKSVSAAAKGADQRAKFRNNNAFEQASFINRELTTSEAQACKGWLFAEDQAFSSMLELCDTGYKITFRADDYNGGYACWILPSKDDPYNAGLILTGRGSSSYKAFKQAYYKHAVLFDEQWPRDGDQRGDTEIDD